jgi:hypothetical protein
MVRKKGGIGVNKEGINGGKEQKRRDIKKG